MNQPTLARPKRQSGFDIQQRTFAFGVRIVKLVGKFPRTVAGIEIGRQLVRAGTSVGSNVEEADAAVSRKDFVNHVRIARKEARESRYWLRMLGPAAILVDPEVDLLAKEADELVRILKWNHHQYDEKFEFGLNRIGHWSFENH